MLAEERQAVALQKLKDAGYLEVVDLARSLAVCPATVRRDLERLQQQGQVMRVRGGAVLAVQSTSLEPPYEVKRQRRMEEKRRIAAAAASMVKEGKPSSSMPAPPLMSLPCFCSAGVTSPW